MANFMEKKEEVLQKIKEILTKNNLSLSTAESCTGGLLSSYLTDISGASEFIFQNFVTYSNDAKNKILKVKKETLDNFGAVSEETAYEMSEGLLDWADTSIATTGILGPTGGSKEKPVGLCYISVGFKQNNKKQIKVIKFLSKKLERTTIKKDIVENAIRFFVEFLESFGSLK